MTEALLPADQESKEKEWTRLSMTLLDRLPLPFAAVWGGVFLLGIASIGLEILLKQRMVVWGPQERSELIEAVATLVVVQYILIHMRLLKQTTIHGLVQLRPAVRIDDAAYEQHVVRMVCDRVVVELIIVALAAGLVVLFFIVPARGGRSAVLLSDRLHCRVELGLHQHPQRGGVERAFSPEAVTYFGAAPCHAGAMTCFTPDVQKARKQPGLPEAQRLMRLGEDLIEAVRHLFQ